MRTSEKGFTLVELLVVIAIIAVLAGVLLIAINPAAMLAKGRDAKRLEDIDTLNKAISLALADGEITLGVNAAQDSATGTQAVNGTGYVRFTIPTGKTGLSKFVPALPMDPTNVDPYVYTFASSATGWELTTSLESPDYTSKLTTDGGNQPAAYEVGTNLTLITPAP